MNGEPYKVLNGLYTGKTKFDFWSNSIDETIKYLKIFDMSSEYINKNFNKFNRAVKFYILVHYHDRVNIYNKYKAILDFECNYWQYCSHKLYSEKLKHCKDIDTDKIWNLNIKSLNRNNMTDEEFNVLCELFNIIGKYDNYTTYLEFMSHFNLKIKSFSPANIVWSIAVHDNNPITKEYLLTLTASQCKKLCEYAKKNNYMSYLKQYINKFNVSNIKNYILINDL